MRGECGFERLSWTQLRHSNQTKNSRQIRNETPATKIHLIVFLKEYVGTISGAICQNNERERMNKLIDKENV